MKIYTFHRKQKLPISLEEAWKFLSNPRNLKTITPEYMSFNIISGAEKPMFAGQIIQYIVTPILGIKTKWVTEITHVKEGEYFVDEQRVGPYSMWHHEHFIQPIENGVLMKDIVSYQPPFGLLGSIANKLIIQNNLKEIFEYRSLAIQKRFGEYGCNFNC